MNGSDVTIRFDSDAAEFQPGQTLSGKYQLGAALLEEVRAVEVSVLWFTEGKGDEDMGVHEFRRHSADNGNWIDPRHPGRFNTVLPTSPLSYDGTIVKIRWCVRVRVFPRRGTEIVADLPFRLGSVPSAKAARS